MGFGVVGSGGHRVLIGNLRLGNTPLFVQQMPRLLWAKAKLGLSSTALRKAAIASAGRL